MICHLWLFLSFEVKMRCPSKEGKEFNTFYGLSKYHSNPNHLRDAGTVFALKSFLGSRVGQHKVVCPPEPWARAEGGDGG